MQYQHNALQPQGSHTRKRTGYKCKNGQSTPRSLAAKVCSDSLTHCGCGCLSGKYTFQLKICLLEPKNSEDECISSDVIHCSHELPVRADQEMAELACVIRHLPLALKLFSIRRVWWNVPFFFRVCFGGVFGRELKTPKIRASWFWFTSDLLAHESFSGRTLDRSLTYDKSLHN